MISVERVSDEILAIYASEFEDGRDNFDLRAKLMKRGIPWGMVATLLRELQAARTRIAELERQAAADAEILSHNMALANANTRKCMDERNGVIRQMREKFSAIEIADMCGLTRQRVHQILNEAPVVVGDQRGHQPGLSQEDREACLQGASALLWRKNYGGQLQTEFIDEQAASLRRLGGQTK